PTLVYTATLNVQKQWAQGIDFEANYQTDLGNWSGLGGTLDLRLLGTHNPTFKTLTRPGAQITNIAGNAAAPASSQPEDKGTLIIDYTNGPLNIDLLERYYSSIGQNANPTIIYNVPNL